MLTLHNNDDPNFYLIMKIDLKIKTCLYHGNNIKVDACNFQFDYYYKFRKVDICWTIILVRFVQWYLILDNEIILNLIVIINIYYQSSLKLEECKDITLGDCSIREEYIIQSISTPTAAICQEACFLFADCNIFNFDGTTCLLLNEDYRQECDTTAAPFVSWT